MTQLNERREIVLEVSGLSVSYDRPILRDVNITIRDVVGRGQVVALLAPSGTGKTQLFNCIAGLQQPSSGLVRILAGKELVPVQAGMVGVVPQNSLLFEDRTVYANLMTAALLKGGSRKEARTRILELLELFGMNDAALQYPQQISGGQRQRASIIQQMLCNSRFLLMDEPFASLDLLKKIEVYHQIEKIALRDELNTIIVTTHDIESAVTIADTVLLLGHDHDAGGNIVPGARIQKEFDLIECGLAWHPEVATLPMFFDKVNEIKAWFPRL
ncbi:MAG: transporter, ATPase subunit [Parcubacteria group bacterium]|nr:transporter, ATPase subunit [Parcubacteria group bacterium]